uniref:Uncharacterized protein n=1 Tax=Arundo donax TaxID=35708 RepID=A0A0A9AXX3_ARUDO
MVHDQVFPPKIFCALQNRYFWLRLSCME